MSDKPILPLCCWRSILAIDFAEWFGTTAKSLMLACGKGGPEQPVLLNVESDAVLVLRRLDNELG
jgi:hypothetical protein